MHPEEALVKTIVCLDSGTDFFGRLSHILEGPERPPEYRLVHWVTIPAQILELCDELAPALVAVSNTFAKALLTEKFSPLISSENLRFLVIVDSLDQSIYEDFLQKGCHGVFEKSSSDKLLLKSIESVFGGELWVPRGVLSQIVQGSLRKGRPKLTSRETEIFKLINLGLKNQQIADRLFISRETVRWHIRGLYTKIGIGHRPGALQHVRYPGRRRRSSFDS